MRRLTLVLTAAVMTAALSLAFAAPTFAARVSSRSAYWFALPSPNTAVSPSGGRMEVVRSVVELRRRSFVRCVTNYTGAGIDASFLAVL